jgi:CHAD domain-containing protein
VRDTDVLQAGLEHAWSRAHSTPLPGFVAATLTAQRRETVAALDEALHSARLETMMALLGAGCDRPPLAAATDPDRLAWPAARGAVRASLRRIARHVKRTTGPASDAELHELRKRAKRARYALELVAPIAPKKRAKRLAAKVADLQSVLGDQHDAVMAVAWLERRRADTEGIDQAAALDELHRAVQAEATPNRNKWRRRWRAAQHHRDVAWLH